MSEAPVGILAGGGGLPLEIARCFAARGRRVSIVAIEGEADADFSGFQCTTVNWGQIGRMVSALRSAGARELVIVGRVKRPDPRNIRPDLGLFLSLPQILKLVTAGGDDGVLRRVVRFFEGKGFRVVGPGEAAPEIVVHEGRLGGVSLAAADAEDAKLGFEVIAALGRFDIGQAAVVRRGKVIALEGAEGTDGMLRRIAIRQVSDKGAGPALRAGVLVKRPKPGQELRIDMPAIGPETVTLAAAAGLAGIAVAAGNVLVADNSVVRDKAAAAGLAIVGLRLGASAPPGGPASEKGLAEIRAQAGAGRFGRDDTKDARRGLGVISALAPYCRSQGVVVVRRHVLGVETGEGVSALLSRVSKLRQWGDRGKRRRGVLVIANGAMLQAAHVSAASAMGLSGIVVPGGQRAEGAAIAEAESLGLCVGQADHAEARLA